MPANYGVVGAGPHQSPGNAEPSRFEKLGIRVQDLTPALAEQLGIKADHGVVIADVRAGSPAELAHLATGMVITEVNRRPVKTVEDFRKALANKPLEKGILLYVQSAEGGQFVNITVIEPK